MEKEIKSLGDNLEEVFDMFKPMFIDYGVWDELDDSFIKWGWVVLYKRLEKEGGINYKLIMEKIKFTQKQLEKSLSYLETLVNKEGFDIEKCRKHFQEKVKNKKGHLINDLITYFNFLFPLPFHKENAYFILNKLKKGIEEEYFEIQKYLIKFQFPFFSEEYLKTLYNKIKEEIISEYLDSGEKDELEILKEEGREIIDCFEVQKYLIKFRFPSKEYIEILGKIKNKLDNEINEIEKYLKSEEKEKLENFKEKVIGITKEKIESYIKIKLENFVNEEFKDISLVDREVEFDNLFYRLSAYITPFFSNPKEEKDWENKYEELKKELKRNSEEYEWNQFKKYLRIDLPKKFIKYLKKGAKKIKEIIDKKMDIYNL